MDSAGIAKMAEVAARNIPERRPVLFDLPVDQLRLSRHAVAMCVQLKIESLGRHGAELIGIHELEDPAGAEILIINSQAS